MNIVQIANLAQKFDLYENGEMSDEETIEFFQTLVNTGMAWQLQGHYGRTAMSLIESGIVHPAVEQMGEA